MSIGAMMVTVVLLLAAIASDFFTKTNFKGIPLFIFFTLLFGIFWGMPFTSFKNSLQEKEATRIIAEIENFKKLNGYYPEEIEKVGILSLYSEFDYFRHAKYPVYYYLSYSLGGWSKMPYSNETQTWIRDDD